MTIGFPAVTELIELIYIKREILARLPQCGLGSPTAAVSTESPWLLSPRGWVPQQPQSGLKDSWRAAGLHLYWQLKEAWVGTAMESIASGDTAAAAAVATG